MAARRDGVSSRAMSGSDVVARGSDAHRQATLARLYAAYFRDVWNWVASLGVRPSDLRDVVHDVFVAAWQSLDSFEGRSSHRTWLFGISANVARNRRARAYVRREDYGEHPEPRSGADPERDARITEAREILDELLEALPDEQREAFLLFELAGYTGAQIAELTSVPVQTVFSRLRAARAHVERETGAFAEHAQ
jgi:RNA polymerase sigma-70 factor, ECF subfamily